MAQVVFTDNIQRHVDCPPSQVSGDTVRQVLDAVFESNERARRYVLDDRGALHTHMAVFVNGEAVKDRVALTDAVPHGAEVYVMQALSGG